MAPRLAVDQRFASARFTRNRICIACVLVE
jgi:hypothetical protein